MTNGILASVPGHPIWEEAMRRIHANWKRSPKMATGSQGELTGVRARAQQACAWLAAVGPVCRCRLRWDCMLE